MLMLGDRTILQRSFEIVEAHDEIDEIVVALPKDLAWAPPPYLVSARKPVRIVDGGLRRQDSVANAFAQVSDRASVIVIHDAARPFATAGLFSRVIGAAARAGRDAAIQASDTVKEATAAPGVRIVAQTLVRESLALAQTPQALIDSAGRGVELGRQRPERLHRQASRRAGGTGEAGRRRAYQHRTTQQDLDVSMRFWG
jgi:2-C-methyl-D-erythritol 4-phosphate cytidylyltransferase/2-C-methyl-D-erythritol 2,4-cyclodiphosphate synthase